MSKIFIAPTTINPPSKALVSLSKLKNFQLVVALDQNSCDFNLKNTVILSPEYQKKMEQVIQPCRMELCC